MVRKWGRTLERRGTPARTACGGAILKIFSSMGCTSSRALQGTLTSPKNKPGFGHRVVIALPTRDLYTVHDLPSFVGQVSFGSTFERFRPGTGGPG